MWGELGVAGWAGAAVSALLVGLSKAGFGAGAGLLAVPLMAAILGPERALGLMLLVLITGDIFSIIHYPRTHDRRSLFMLIPGLVCGVTAGYFLLGWFQGLPHSELWLKRLIGSLSVAFVGIQLLRTARERHLGTEGRAYDPRAWQGIAIGFCGGVTSTLAHAGGPIVALFLLPQRLSKRVFVGTFVKYFFIGNAVKIVPYAMKGLLTGDVLLMSLVLLPAVVVGTFLGLYLQGRFSDSGFRLLIYTLAVCIGVSLMASRAKAEGPAEPQQPSGPAALWQEGLDAYGSGDFATAESAFTAVMHGRPKAPLRARFNRALALYGEGRYRDAGHSFALLAGLPDAELAARAAMNAGNCAFRQGSYADAMSWYSRALVLAASTQAEATPEVARRARHNLRLSRSRLAVGPPTERADGAAAGRARRTEQGSGPAAPIPAAAGRPGKARSLAGPATGMAVSGKPGVRSVVALLSEVASRDTGPVLGLPRAPASVARPGW